jgi:hypothetical protein
MSQQTNSGFNAPGFSVGADDPFKTAVFNAIPPSRPGGTFAPVPSLARAVGHVPIIPGKPSGRPCELWFGPPFDPSVARGVGHTIRPSNPFTGTFGQ